MAISESLHFYDREGNPCYQVPYADPSKGMRNTTLRDARKLSLVPSVTAILNIQAKPGLERWKQNQLLLSALTLPKIEGETLDDFSYRVMQDSKEQGEQARNKGTAIHAAIEQFYLGEEYDPDFEIYVKNVDQELQKYYGTQQYL